MKKIRLTSDNYLKLKSFIDGEISEMGKKSHSCVSCLDTGLSICHDGIHAITCSCQQGRIVEKKNKVDSDQIKKRRVNK